MRAESPCRANVTAAATYVDGARSRAPAQCARGLFGIRIHLSKSRQSRRAALEPSKSCSAPVGRSISMLEKGGENFFWPNKAKLGERFSSDFVFPSAKTALFTAEAQRSQRG